MKFRITLERLDGEKKPPMVGELNEIHPLADARSEVRAFFDAMIELEFPIPQRPQWCGCGKAHPAGAR